MKPMRRGRLDRILIGLTAALMVAPAVCQAADARIERTDVQSLTVDSELSTRMCRLEESNLANIVVDAIRAVEKSDVGLMHGSAFGDTTIAKGKCSSEDVLKAIQYREDLVVIVKLTGAQIRRALENGLKLHPQKSPEFLQVSGMTITVDPNADKDKRVVDVRVGSSKLDNARKYSVAMPSPLANGALGYYKIWDKTQAIDHETSKTVGQAVLDYLNGHKSLGAKTEDRIVFK